MTLSQGILALGRAWRNGVTGLGPRFGDLHNSALVMERRLAELEVMALLQQGVNAAVEEPPVVKHLPTTEGELPAWKANAREQGCYCASYRKPCPYHEGYQDGYDAKEAS